MTKTEYAFNLYTYEVYALEAWDTDRIEDWWLEFSTGIRLEERYKTTNDAYKARKRAVRRLLQLA